MRISKRSFDTLIEKAKKNEACFNCAHCIARSDCKLYNETLKGNVYAQESHKSMLKYNRTWEYNSFCYSETLCVRHLLTTIYKACRTFVEKEGLIID